MGLPIHKHADVRSLDARIALLLAAQRANGVQTVWRDPSNLAAQFQTAAGTGTAAAGTPIGRTLDLSGAGNHFEQAASGARKTLRQDGALWSWQFDGVDDGEGTAAPVNFGASDEVTVIAAVRKTSDVSLGVVAELSGLPALAVGCWSLLAPANLLTSNYGFMSKGNIAAEANTPATFAAPETVVLTGQGKIGAKLATLRRNGVAVASSTVTQGSVKYGAHTLYCGARGNGSLRLTGHEYGMLIIGALLQASDLALCEKWAASKAGIVL